MCNTCVQPVQTLLKTRGDEHRMCAASTSPQNIHGQNYQLSTSYPHRFTHQFSTHIWTHFNLLSRMLSTLYTGPITTYN
jgi:hypothetical protein